MEGWEEGRDEEEEEEEEDEAAVGDAEPPSPVSCLTNSNIDRGVDKNDDDEAIPTDALLLPPPSDSERLGLGRRQGRRLVASPLVARRDSRMAARKRRGKVAVVGAAKFFALPGKMGSSLPCRGQRATELEK